MNGKRFGFLLCFFQLVFFASAQQRPKVAFVLSGGGARGFAHVGALKVLEEAGFKPDIITGTSMGSVVGGLYAIGYRSDTLEKIIRNTEWDDIVYDKVSRNTLTAVERERYDRYFVKFNFEGIKFISYSGLVKGTRVHNMLSRLCLPASNITDFTKLPIPFVCVATDIQSGEKVVLKKGYLPDAIRASMAIPSMFTSIELDGKILVDGGLTQNYPITEAKDLGADIIIGIDVGTKSSKEELGSFVNIMMESMFLHGYQNFHEEKKYLTVNIKPDMSGVSPLDFGKGDSIMKIGEVAARLHMDELRALHKKLYGNKIDTPIVSNMGLLNGKYKVKEVKVEGLKNTYRSQINFILDKAQGRTVNAAEIEDIVMQLENTNLFERILYRFDNSADKGRLVLYVTEKPRGEFDVGINYNSYHDASLLVGLSYKRFIFKGTHLKADMRLSSMPRIDLSYFYQTRFKPSVGLEMSVNTIEQGYYQNNVKISTSYNVLSSLYLKAKYNISNYRNLAIGVGIEGVNNRTDAFISLDQLDQLINRKQSNNIILSYRGDSRDDTYIPMKGGRTLLDFYWANNNLDINKSWFSGILRIERHTKIAKRIHIGNYVDVGMNDANYQPGNTQFLFLMGGMLDMRFRYYVPFAGVEFSQIVANNMAHYRFKPSYRLFKNNFISGLFDAAETSVYTEDLLRFTGMMYAYGASYEYRSPIGPMQFNVSRSNVNNALLFYLNLGYWF
jgi:NTE family protein